MYDQETARSLYKRLLTLYPHAFREQLGESMQQTFNDLYNERKRQKEQGLFGFVLWMFVETAMGVVREHVLRIAEGVTMKTMLANWWPAALISLLLVVPFALLEFVFNPLTKANAFNPKHLTSLTLLFGVMWLLPTLVIAILMPLVRNVRAGNTIMAQPVFLLLRVVVMVIIAWGWGTLVLDQLPCFLGVPNCD